VSKALRSSRCSRFGVDASTGLRTCLVWRLSRSRHGRFCGVGGAEGFLSQRVDGFGTGGAEALRSGGTDGFEAGIRGSKASTEKAQKLGQVGRLVSFGKRDSQTPGCEGAGGEPIRAKDCACVVASSTENVMSVCFRVSRGQRSGDHLEEHKTRGGERSLVRPNHRPSGSRLCMEQSLEVEELGLRPSIRR
jgi:hypothetical protein